MPPTNERRESIIRAVIFGLIALTAVSLIAFLKRSSDIPLTPEGIAHRDSISRFAIPDTTETPEATPSLAPAETYPAPDDSISVDTRIPSDAGYQDGYFAGLEDGLADKERYSYDESSQFPTAAQRRNYAAAYRRGYQQGFNDGQAGQIENALDGEYHDADPDADHHHAPAAPASPTAPPTAPAKPMPPAAPAKPAATSPAPAKPAAPAPAKPAPAAKK